MSHEPAGTGKHDIPPAKYFRFAPTFEQWCRLSIADVVCTLREVAGFEGQQVLFYGNHPIQYACLVGFIAAIDATNGPTMITLDDGSGYCIDLLVRKSKHSDEPGITSVDKLRHGFYQGPDGLVPDPMSLELDGRALTVGLVVKAKGTFSSFRNIRQIELKRLFIVKDTAEEVALWSAQADFKNRVLSKPWVLTSAERTFRDAQMKQEEAQRTLQAARHALQEKKKVRKREQRARRGHDKAKDEEAERAALEKEMNEGALL